MGSDEAERKSKELGRPMIPLFVCHANCCRSVLAYYCYRHLCADVPALSAGFEPGAGTSERALAMLERWGIDARGHRPSPLHRGLCDEASAIFIMAPSYLHRLLLEYGHDLASKAYLFADPFSRPHFFGHGEYKVHDPSFDERTTLELVREFSWMRERVLQIRLALLGDGRPMVPAAAYLSLLQVVDPRSH
jgi:protein-tyrosine-phosphatase